MSTYPAFKPIPLLHRDITITEKVDGTNGLVHIEPFPDEIGTGDWQSPAAFDDVTWVRHEGVAYVVRAGSRNRWLSATADNFGFFAWVQANAQTLVHDLGPGHHYGEWFGSGIQRGYGMVKGHRSFALFNVARFEAARPNFLTPNLDVVPVMRIVTGDRLNEAVFAALDELRTYGSVIAPGFDNPEGVVVYHRAANQLFKATLDNDHLPKSLAANVIEFTPTEPGRYIVVGPANSVVAVQGCLDIAV